MNQPLATYAEFARFVCDKFRKDCAANDETATAVRDELSKLKSADMLARIAALAIAAEVNSPHMESPLAKLDALLERHSIGAAMDFLEKVKSERNYR